MSLRSLRSIAIAGGFLLSVVTAAGAEPLTVSAAISLKEAIAAVGKAYHDGGGDDVQFNFGASGALAMQIAQGAPVDVFVSADPEQVEKLINDGKADAGTRRLVVENELVLIVNPSNANPALHDFGGLADPQVQRVAIGQPKVVPAGMYAMQVLDHLHLTNALQPKLIYASNVRQVLDYVVRNEVDAGIVYRTDALQAGEKVTVVYTAGAGMHEPIDYPAIMVSGTTHAEAARRFLDYLTNGEARTVFAARGFVIPPDHSPATHPAAVGASGP
jgi:molybdate transport system substrate-binding protein